LQQIWRDTPELFFSQYQNEPLGSDQVHFGMKDLRDRVVIRQQVPMDATMVCAWYLPFSKTRKSDISCCALGAYDTNGNLFVVDILRGRFSPSNIIDNIIYSYKKWPVARIGLEKKKMTALLGPALHAKQIEQRISLPIDGMTDESEENLDNKVLSLAP